MFAVSLESVTPLDTPLGLTRIYTASKVQCYKALICAIYTLNLSATVSLLLSLQSTGILDALLV
jgi:hypothetical protein